MTRGSQGLGTKYGWVVAVAAVAVALVAAADTATGAGSLPRFRTGNPGRAVSRVMARPKQFKLSNGMTGWKVEVPNPDHPPTPAVDGGTVYVAGGFNSHTMLALDSRTGRQKWAFHTGDNGPSAPTVEGRYLVYGSESCTLYMHDGRTGKPLWSRWLGDPLLSQPAVADGSVYTVYPGSNGEHHLVSLRLTDGKVLWDQAVDGDAIATPVIDGQHVYLSTANGFLYRFDAATGRKRWSNRCFAASAPQVRNGAVHVNQWSYAEIPLAGKKPTTAVAPVEGLNVFAADSGRARYRAPLAAVPAAHILAWTPDPNNVDNVEAAALVWLNALRQAKGAKNVAAALKDYRGRRPRRLVAAERVIDYYVKREFASSLRGAAKAALEAEELAGELAAAKTSVIGNSKEAQAARDAMAAAAKEFQSLAETGKRFTAAVRQVRDRLPKDKTDRRIEPQQLSQKELDESLAAARSVRASNYLRAQWIYFHARPCVVGNTSVTAAGDTLRGIDTTTGKTAWTTRIKVRRPAARAVTPAAIAGGKLYLGTSDGRLVCMRPRDGKVLWQADLGSELLFEPAVADGRIYTVTRAGTLYCLETGDRTADGWPMWGGSPTHNGSRAAAALAERPDERPAALAQGTGD
jgi:outer membrane protein assembly factor BamB